ncbi:MAG: conjugal transfer protein TraG [Proteobacteria bacterium]|nr:conjugal transfer protein TraG [Pseudomonadota bacterium]
MVFDIFSIGDSAFLEAILNAVAMIAGTGHYTMAAGVGALLGTILMLLRGILQWDGRGIRYQEMIAAILIYLAMFAPSVKVAIEDAYTGQVRVVDNVPLGPAVAGSILSNLGYRLTRLFEQGFSTPSMTQYGFADALQVVTAVRKNLLSRIELGKANAPTAGGDLENSLINYVKECTLTGVDLNLNSLDTILRTPQVLDAIRFDSQIYTTEIYLGGAPQVLTCTEAWTALDTYVQNHVVPGLEDILRAGLKAATPGDVQPRVQAALDTLTGGAVSALDYMLAATLLPMFEKGVIGRHEDGQHWNKAAMVEQAIQQRNGQWAAEQSLFTRIVRPMMTWIEGFSYAITPLMAFAVLLGARGIQIAGQYLLMLLWIQLWMPILAVINLYITMSATGELSALDAAQFNLPSMLGLYRMDMEIQNWLAVGGMLASSTPAIALMLVYGGSITATHFLGRMQGGDFVDEKITSPAVIGPAPVLNLQPMAQHAPLSGTTLYGAERVLPTFQAGSDLSASVSSAFGALRQASSSFMESLSNTASRSSSLSHEGFDSHALAHRIASSSSQTDKFVQATGEDFAQRYRDSGVSGNDFAALVGGAASGSLRTRQAKESGEDQKTRSGLQGSLSGQLQNRFHVERSRADEIASDIAQRVTEDHGWQADLARSVATDAQAGTREVASLGLQQQDLSSLQRSASDTLSASESYDQTVSAQRRFGVSASYGAAETGLRLASDTDSMGRLDSALDRFGLRGDAQRLGAEWRTTGLVVDKEQAYAAAGMALLTGYSSPMFRKLSEDEARQAETAGYQILGDVWDAPAPGPNLSPANNAGLANQAPHFGDVSSAVQSASLHDPRNAVGDLGGQVRSQIQGTSNRVSAGETEVGGAYDAGRSAVRTESSSGFGAMHTDKAAYLRAEIAKAANSQSSAAELEYDVIGGSIYSATQAISAAGHGSVQGFLNAFDAARNRGETWSESLFSAIKSTPDEAWKAIQGWASQRAAETGTKLTPAQRKYYEAAMIESFAGVQLSGNYSPYQGHLSSTEQRLEADHGDASQDIASLLRRAAGQNRSDLIDLLANYNRAQSGN